MSNADTTAESVGRPHRPAGLLARVGTSRAVRLFRILPMANRRLAFAWWALLVGRGLVPSVAAVALGWLTTTIGAGGDLVPPVLVVGACFVLLQVLPQVHTAVSTNLGSQLSALLNDRLAAACVAPVGIGHLEDPELAADLTTARDFDRGISGPPMYLNIEFIAGSLTQLAVGVVAAVTLAGYAWWAALVLVVAWASTHWLLRESGVWKDRNTEAVNRVRQQADYAYRLAVEPEPAKELRLFGLQDWLLARFATVRRELFELQYAATRLREKSMTLAVLVVLAANLVVLGALGWLAVTGTYGVGQLITMAQLAIAIQFVAFGGLSWALDDASGPVLAVERLEPRIGPAGALPRGSQAPPSGQGIGITVSDLRFGYPRTGRNVYDGLDLTITPGESIAIVGSNGAGKTTLAKLLCRFYDPVAGSITADGVDLREIDVDAWRTRVAAVFQDLLRLEKSLRDNVDPGHLATDDQVRRALHDAGADGLAELDTPLAKGYPGGVDLSGGQWQRIALARALCAVRRGAGLVLLDEPTANLDVRGEATIFARLLEETRGVTVVLISHRFSTVRMADRIAVLTDGRVTELGTHAELMAAGGRYQRMFDLQARRFDASSDEEGATYDSLT